MFNFSFTFKLGRISGAVNTRLPIFESVAIVTLVVAGAVALLML